MKKNFVIALILGLVLSLEAVSAQTVGNLSKPFVDIMKSGKYTMKFRSEQKVSGQTVTFEAQQYSSGEKMAIIGNQGGHTVKIIVRDGKSYMVDDTTKVIFAMPNVNDAKKMGVNTAAFNYSKSGQEVIFGGNLPYDEYITDSGTMRMYVKAGKLAGFKVTSASADPVIIEILDFSDKVDESVFTLPAGYNVLG